MNQRLWQTAIERAGRLAARLALDELPGADLHGGFLTARDEPAFAAIVRRHGPLVWGVCRGLPAAKRDVEGLCMAPLLALFRSVPSLQRRNALEAGLPLVSALGCGNALRTKARRARY